MPAGPISNRRRPRVIPSHPVAEALEGFMAGKKQKRAARARISSCLGGPEEAEAGVDSMGVNVNKVRFVPLTEPAQWACP